MYCKLLWFPFGRIVAYKYFNRWMIFKILLLSAMIASKICGACCYRCRDVVAYPINSKGLLRQHIVGFGHNFHRFIVPS